MIKHKDNQHTITLSEEMEAYLDTRVSGGQSPIEQHGTKDK
jgi:hypothetical protein